MSIIPEFVEDKFNIDQIKVATHLQPMMDILIDGILCFIEYPYVDRFYRDSYYNFFSKKHTRYIRDSIRISFFFDKIDSANYFNIEENNIEDSYLGFITLRPTTYRIIGHSFISPCALKNKNFVCCLSKKIVSVYGRKLSVTGFPYISQDNESITCSEASIINLMDYFGHKYPEYSTILPSQVARILSRQSYQRQLPAHGLPTESISYVLKKIGFGTIVYSKGSKKEDLDLFDSDNFKDLLYIYIESGIPLIATLSSKNGNHAVLVIGRESIDHKIQYSKRLLKCKKGKQYKFSESFQKVLIMNDNHPPYEMVDYFNPIYDSESQSYFQFTSFITPLYTKVFLDAYQFKKFLQLIIESLKKSPQTNHVEFIQEDQEYIYRFFLASSKSYKNYLSSLDGLSNEVKALTIGKKMPKFIWVGEIIKGNEIDVGQAVESIIIVDATESGLYGHLIFATNSKFLIMNDSDGMLDDGEPVEQAGRYKIFTLVKEIFYTFANNLKGGHTKWQN